MKAVISECNTLITITLSGGEEVLSWEDLQNAKDVFWPDLDFFEVYPKKKEIINNANERHLVHVKDWSSWDRLPKMSDFERSSDILIRKKLH